MGAVSFEAPPIAISGPISTESSNSGSSYDDIQFQEKINSIARSELDK